MQWSLEDIYKNQVRGNVPRRKHLRVLGENEQGEIDFTFTGGKDPGGGRGKKKVQRKDDDGKPVVDSDGQPVYDIVDDPKFKPKTKFVDAPAGSKADFTFTTDDLEEINMLQPEVKHRINRLLGKRDTQNSFKELFKDGLSGITPKLEDEFIEALIVSDDITSDEIRTLYSQIKDGTAINVEKILNASDGQVFSYKDIFTDEGLKAYIAAKKVGTGGKQAGPGEAALAALSPVISQEGKGDINIAGNLVELKEGDGRVGLESKNPGTGKINSIFKKYLNKNWNQELKDAANDNVHNSKPGQATLNIEGLWWLMQILDENEKNGNIQGLASGWRRRLPEDLFKEFFTESYIINELVESVNEKSVGAFTRDYIKALFDNYKKSKESGEGKWDILLAINTTNPKLGGIAVVKSGEQLLNVRAKRSLPSIIKSGPAGNRDYTYAFSPYGPEENEEYEEF
tara:strand:+ start:1233 stop:2597 length:1365 start_codon:yes stop_codon:yes gene_type:complete